MKKDVWRMKGKVNEREADIKKLKANMNDTATPEAIEAHRRIIRGILKDMFMEDCRHMASIRIKKQFPKCSEEEDM